MKRTHSKYVRVLGISPSTRGFGFAVLEDRETLVDWGVKSVKGDKNARSLAKVGELIDHYRPGIVILPDNSTIPSRRSARIQALSREIIAMITDRGITVEALSGQQVRRVFFANGQGTKHALAEILAKQFPAELGFRLPPKRRAWMSEDYRMDIFDAVALVLVLRLKKSNRTG